jgi:arginine/lysine/ornithine decarboxylase
MPYSRGVPLAGNPIPGSRGMDSLICRPDTPRWIRFLKMLQDLDNEFPDFGLHVQGVKTESSGGKKTYMVDCIKEDVG